jgi:hypothetical protein
MRQSEIDRDIATEAAVRIVYSLIYDKSIPVESIFKFMESSDKYRNFLNNDNVLIEFLHDNSIYDLIDVLGEQINGQN